MSTANVMTEGTQFPRAQDAGLYDRLAERAARRFEMERRIQWRNAAAIWLMFGVGAIVVLCSPIWAPEYWEAALDTLFALAVVLLYAVWYLPRRLKKLHRDNEIAYWWDTHLQKVLGGEHLPPELEPGPGWPSAVGTEAVPPAETGTAPIDPNEKSITAAPRTRWYVWQLLINVEFAITVALAVLFVSAVWSRAYHSESRRPQTRFTIEGLEVDSLSGVRAVRPGETRTAPAHRAEAVPPPAPVTTAEN